MIIGIVILSSIIGGGVLLYLFVFKNKKTSPNKKSSAQPELNLSTLKPMDSTHNENSTTIKLIKEDEENNKDANAEFLFENQNPLHRGECRNRILKSDNDDWKDICSRPDTCSNYTSWRQCLNPNMVDDNMVIMPHTHVCKDENGREISNLESECDVFHVDFNVFDKDW